MAEFEQIYRTYFQDVYHFACKLSKDKIAAEEITSETFFKAMRSIEQFRGECEIRVWLCQIAKNVYFDQYKNSRREAPLQETEEIADTVKIEDVFLEGCQSMEIHRILHRLKEPYKEVFMLRILGELTFRQIGASFGKTENWACVTYHRAKDKIQKQLEEWK